MAGCSTVQKIFTVHCAARGTLPATCSVPYTDVIADACIAADLLYANTAGE
jgi:hypothetical protein